LLLVSQTCQVESVQGNCIELEEPSTALGVGVGALGVGALAGAIYWWIAGAPDDPEVLPSTQETP